VFCVRIDVSPGRLNTSCIHGQAPVAQKRRASGLGSPFWQPRLRRSPVASAVAVLSVALGIGANTAICSRLSAIAWRPLAVPNPEALVQLQAFEPRTGKEVGLPVPVLRALREQRQ